MTQVEGDSVDQHPNQREEVNGQGGLSEKTREERGLKSAAANAIDPQTHTGTVAVYEIYRNPI